MIIPMNDYKFAVLILTHGRANNVITYNTLRRCGYTGEIWIVIDNEDSQADEYRRIYGDKVVMFDKPEIASRFDEGDNFHDRRAIIYARNASFEIAEKLGLNYFVQMDDDYTGFRYRFNQELIYKDPENAKTHYSNAIQACISCHEVKCSGPIVRIKKLQLN